MSMRTARRLSKRRSAVYIAGNDVDDLSAAGVKRLRGGHVTLEDGRKGCPVRDVENAEGADRHMQVDGVDVAAERALLLTSRQQVAQGADDRIVQSLDDLRTRDIGAIQDVLVHDQAHEFRMRILVVESEGNQGAQGFFGRLM